MDYPMTDDDGDGIWARSFPVPSGYQDHYAFFYGAMEDLSGQDCADPNNDDYRTTPVVTEDTVISVSFGVCPLATTASAPTSPEPADTVKATSAPTGCDEAAWPDKDHGLVCGECKVLVNRFNSFYGSCDGYCSSIGRVCTGAWEEDGDKCTVKYAMECNQEVSSSDAICECGEAGTTVNATSAQTGCDEAAWPDKDHDLVCGECKVLVNRFNSFYGSCDGYCSSIGRVCTGAWEEDGDKCTVKYAMECNQSLHE